MQKGNGKRRKSSHSIQTLHLNELPIEMGIEIICYLELKDRINIYNRIPQLRKYFAAKHVENLKVAGSVLASAVTLKGSIISDLGCYIQCLDLKGSTNLTAEALRPHVNRFSNLKSLDVAQTGVRLEDFPEICPANLRSISINFFESPNEVRKETLINCLNIFIEKLFENIQFTIFSQSGETPHNCLAYYRFLNHIPLLHKVKMTVYLTRVNFVYSSNFQRDFTEYCYDFINGKPDTSIIYNMSDVRVKEQLMNEHLTLFAEYPTNLREEGGFEYIFMQHGQREGKYAILATLAISSQLFYKPGTRLSDQCELYVLQNIIPTIGFVVDQGRLIFKAWDIAATVFDHKFFDVLLHELKECFPLCFTTVLQDPHPEPAAWN